MSSSFTRVPSPADSAAETIVMGPRAQALTGPRLPLAFVVGCVVATLTVALVESAHAKRIVGTNGPDRLVGTAKADQDQGSSRQGPRQGPGRKGSTLGRARRRPPECPRRQAGPCRQGRPGQGRLQDRRGGSGQDEELRDGEVGKGGGPGAGQNCVSRAGAQARGGRRCRRPAAQRAWGRAAGVQRRVLRDHGHPERVGGRLGRRRAPDLDRGGVRRSASRCRARPHSSSGGEGIAIISADYPGVRRHGGQQLKGDAATIALAGADSRHPQGPAQAPAAVAAEREGRGGAHIRRSAEPTSPIDDAQGVASHRPRVRRTDVVAVVRKGRAR